MAQDPLHHRNDHLAGPNLGTKRNDVSAVKI